MIQSDSFRPRMKITHSSLIKVKDDNFVLNNFVDNEITTMINILPLCVQNKSLIIIIMPTVKGKIA